MKTSLIKKKRSTGRTAISLSARSVLESATQGTVIGVLSSAFGTAPYTFSIVSDPDSKFAVSGSNLVVRTGASFNFETKVFHTVTVRSTDATTAFKDYTFTILVTDVADGPTTTGATTTLAAMVGTISTWKTLSGDLRNLFVSPTGQTLTFSANIGTITGGFNWSYQVTYDDFVTFGDFRFDIEITATDQDGQSLTISLLDQQILYDPAPLSYSSTLTINYNVLAGSAPVLSTPSPADNATGIPNSTNIVDTWDKPILAGAAGKKMLVRDTTLNSTVKSYDASADAGAGAGKFTISGAAITFVPPTVWPAGDDVSRQYDAGFVTNLGGIPCAAITGDTTLNFGVSSLTAPAAVTDGMFSVADTKQGDGKFSLTLSSLPSDGGSALTDFDVSLDGGSTWPLALGAATTGTYLVQGTYKTAHSVKLRARNAIGAGAANTNAKSVTPKGIRLRGVTTTDIASGNSATTKSVSLTGLTGGSGSSAQIGDIVIAIAAGSSGADIGFPTPTPATYTDIRARQYVSPSTNDITMLCSQKILSAADTTVDWGTFIGNGAQGKVFHLIVLEGVDSATPLDGVSVVSNTLSNSGLIDLTSITLTTLGAWIMGIFGSAFGSTGKTYVVPSNMTQLTNSTRPTGTRGVSLITAFNKPTSIAAFDPAAMTMASGSTDASTDSVAGVLFVLKPE